VFLERQLFCCARLLVRFPDDDGDAALRYQDRFRSAVAGATFLKKELLCQGLASG
jgi:hypothetical protein